MTRPFRVLRITLPSAAIACAIGSLLLLFLRPESTGSLRTTLNAAGILLVIAVAALARARTRPHSR